MIMKYPYKFDRKRREQARAYTRIRIINGVINGILLPIAFFCVFLAFGSGAGLRALLPSITLYAFVFITLLNLVQLPLRFYSGFILEHRYGLSRQRLLAWLKDYLKGIFLGYVFSVPLIFILYALLPLNNWWVYAGAVYVLLTVFIAYIFPIVIFPFFYKIVPYKDTKMKQRLIKMAARFGKRIDNVLVAKESEKSTKVNAMFAGLGQTKRIVLFDNLLKYFHKDEVETVIGHELGHYVNRDSIRYIIIDAVKIFPILLIIDYILRSNTGNFGITAINDVASLPLFLLAYSTIDIILMPALNSYSRHRESEADLFALRACNKPKAQESTEKRLADLDLVDDRPHPLVEFVLFSHPATWRRIKMCREWRKMRHLSV